MPPNPVPSQDVLDYIKRMERRVAELERKTLRNVVIPEGGLTIRGGGELDVLHPSGTWLLHVGKGAQDKYFLTIRRDNGTAAYEISTVADGQQVWTMWDGESRVLIGEDQDGGIARPWLPMPTVDVLATSIPMTASATYVSTQSTGWVLKQQPKADLQALLRSSGGGVGTARFTVNGAPIGDEMPIGANQFGWTSIQAVTLPGNFNTYVRVELQVVLTSATGEVGGTLVSTQRQS